MRVGKNILAKKEKSSKNKTIDFNIDEGKRYSERIIKDYTKKLSIKDITDKTINGDFSNVIKVLPNKFVDLLIVDPPYNLTKNYHGKIFDKQNKDFYYEYTKDWIKKIIPILKDNASIYVCCDWESSLIIGNVMKEFFHVHNRITWQREKGRGAKNNWKNGMEDIWFASVSKTFYFDVEKVKVRKKVIAPYRVDGIPKDWVETEKGNFRNSYPSNFWDDISIPYWSMPENTAHPTQKPEKLLAKLILASSKPGDFVFDPFLGSGSTLVTAKKLGRHFCGIEINEQYCLWTEHRLYLADNNKEIQGYKGGVFWERNTLAEQNKYEKNLFNFDDESEE
jgi:site-specific DNA-methyltransferase (adenine-specific)